MPVLSHGGIEKLDRRQVPVLSHGTFKKKNGPAPGACSFARNTEKLDPRQVPVLSHGALTNLTGDKFDRRQVPVLSCGALRGKKNKKIDQRQVPLLSHGALKNSTGRQVPALSHGTLKKIQNKITGARCLYFRTGHWKKVLAPGACTFAGDTENLTGVTSVCNQLSDGVALSALFYPTVLPRENIDSDLFGVRGGCVCVCVCVCACVRVCVRACVRACVRTRTVETLVMVCQWTVSVTVSGRRSRVRLCRLMTTARMRSTQGGTGVLRVRVSHPCRPASIQSHH